MKRLLFFLLFPLVCFGQGARFDNIVFKNVTGNATVIQNALITVCSAGGSGIPCTPTVANIFSDLAMTVPIVGTGGAGTTNSDGNGNFFFVVPPATTYFITVSGAGLTGYSFYWTAPVIGNGNNGQSGSNTHSGSETFTGPINLTGAGSAAVQTALNNIAAGQALIIPCGTYTGPNLNFNNISITSVCAPFNQDQAGGGGTAVTAQTVFTYGANLTFSGVVNVKLSGITLDFADSGFGVVMNSVNGFRWSDVNIHECGDTGTPCVTEGTNGTSGSFNSTDNHFDHITIKPNTKAAHYATGIYANAQTGSGVTLEYWTNLTISGNIKCATDMEFNTDTHYFTNTQVFQLLNPTVANTGVHCFNLNTPASDQDSDGGWYQGTNYTGASWNLVRAGQSVGNVIDYAGGNLTTVSVAGGVPQFSGRQIGLPTNFSTYYQCVGQFCQQAMLPYYQISFTGRTTALGSTLMYTTTGAGAYIVTASLSCDSSSAAASVQLFVTWTDPSNTVQSASGAANPVCTTLGSASYQTYVFPINVKSGTQILFNTAIANTPTYTLHIKLDGVF